MGKVTGFKEFDRQAIGYSDPKKRLETWNEFLVPLDEEELHRQGGRCMDCGVPFCQSDTGCPIDNLIPEWNDLVYQGNWRAALERLHRTNNFPEFTGRVCPAPCEGACVLGIHEPPVAIKSLEMSIVDRGFDEGWIEAQPPSRETGKCVAVIGSGPAGLAAAQQLRRVGHGVIVYERADVPGGLLTYGIPNMKLEKETVERRIQQLHDEGVRFECGVEVGRDLSIEMLHQENDAVLLSTGATVPRDLPVEGRELKGVHFAMDYLTATTKSLLTGEKVPGEYFAKGKKVLVIGGGDTGTDCIGSALRQGCASVVNFEIMAKPGLGRADGNPWPEFPRVFKIDYGHAEATAVFGKDPREFAISTVRFVDDGEGNVKGVETVRIEQVVQNGRRSFVPVPGSEETFACDMVLLAMGFLGPESPVVEGLELARDGRSNFLAEEGKYQTSIDGIFAAGDCRRGQSLVVWAIAEGRGAARAIDAYLMGESQLPAPPVHVP